MIGTGVFTSLGFQVGDLPSGFVIAALWMAGGVCALCGALCYAELAASLPRSGGEYHLISTTIHPMAGFLSGWLSSTVGFAAPIALSAMALDRYASAVFWPGGTSHGFIAIGAVTIVTLIHYQGVRAGSWFQNTATLLKLTLILVVLLSGLVVRPGQPITFTPQPGDGALLGSHAFAISLVYVMYAYSGWNAATYIVGEIREPGRNVPRALIFGTGLVTILYVALNAVFLHVAPIEALRGKVEVGLVAGEYIFGPTGGRIIGGFICLGLIASCSAMTWIGSRVSATMGEDYAAMRWLSARDRRGAPHVALFVQLGIVILLIAVAAFDTVLLYIQFGLTLFSVLTVVGLMVDRRRRPNANRPFRVPLYPLTPLVFIFTSGWMLAYMLRDKQTQVPSLIGLATILAGLIVYAISPRRTSAETSGASK